MNLPTKFHETLFDFRERRVKMKENKVLTHKSHSQILWLQTTIFLFFLKD